MKAKLLAIAVMFLVGCAGEAARTSAPAPKAAPPKPAVAPCDEPPPAPVKQPVFAMCTE